MNSKSIKNRYSDFLAIKNTWVLEHYVKVRKKSCIDFEVSYLNMLYDSTSKILLFQKSTNCLVTNYNFKNLQRIPYCKYYKFAIFFVLLNLLQITFSIVPKRSNCGQFYQQYTRKFFLRTSFWQLFSSYMYIEKVAKTTFVQRRRAKNVDEIDPWCVKYYFLYLIMIPIISVMISNRMRIWSNILEAGPIITDALVE